MIKKSLPAWSNDWEEKNYEVMDSVTKADLYHRKKSDPYYLVITRKLCRNYELLFHYYEIFLSQFQLTLIFCGPIQLKIYEGTCRCYELLVRL